jgi:hypothetical protein
VLLLGDVSLLLPLLPASGPLLLAGERGAQKDMYSDSHENTLAAGGQDKYSFLRGVPGGPGAGGLGRSRVANSVDNRRFLHSQLPPAITPLPENWTSNLIIYFDWRPDALRFGPSNHLALASFLRAYPTAPVRVHTRRAPRLSDVAAVEGGEFHTSSPISRRIFDKYVKMGYDVAFVADPDVRVRPEYGGDFWTSWTSSACFVPRCRLEYVYLYR